MRAVVLRLRAEVRVRWTAWVTLALIAGLASGVAVGAAAAARRTGDAYRRFLAASNAFDAIVVPPDDEDEPARRMLEASARSDRLSDHVIVDLAFGFIETPTGETFTIPDVIPLVARDPRFGVTFNRAKLLEGRRADQSRADEVVLSKTAKDILAVRVGDVLKFRPPSLRSGQAQAGAHPDAPIEEWRVVGVQIAPGELQPISGGSLPAVHLTTAFRRAHEKLLQAQDAGFFAKFKRGAADLEPFQEELRKQGVETDVFLRQSEQAADFDRSARYEAVALLVLGGFVALTGALILLQLLSRQAHLETDDYRALRALGMSQRQIVAGGVARALAIGAAAGLLGLIIAFLSSRFTPTGIAGVVEPQPGMLFDGFALGLGSLATVGVVLVLSLLPAWRVASLTRSADGGDTRAPSRPSAIVSALASIGARPAAVAGTRLALERGRGRSAVPVRTTILGTMFGLTALFATSTFATSLTHLLTTPSLSGWTYDAAVGVETDARFSQEDAEELIRNDPHVEAYSAGLLPVFILNGDHTVVGTAMSAGPIEPAIAEGRAPRTSDEVVLSKPTLDELDLRIGDAVGVQLQTTIGEEPGAKRTMNIVGRVVMPRFFFSAGKTGEGGAVTMDGARALFPGIEPDGVFVRVRGDHRESLQKLRERLASEVGEVATFVLPRKQPRELADLERVSNLPRLLVAVLGLLALATLVHTLISSIRRRRRDFAILRTLGFVRGQLRATVLWQASVITFAAVLLSIPLGLGLGRWAWNAFVDTLGFIAVPKVPAPLIVVVAIVSIALANLIALVPARVAARMQPAAILRTE